LTVINGGVQGQKLTLMSVSTGRTINVIDSLNISLSVSNNVDFPMNSDNDVIELICRSPGVWKSSAIPQNHT